MIEWWNRLRDFLRRGQLAAELDEELRFHREHLTADRRAQGMNAREAGYAARRRLGNLTWIAEEARAVWSFAWVESVTQDLSYAARSLARRPAFAFVIIATIALGVGANSAMFSVVSGILLRPLPYPQPDRLVSFGHEPPQWLTSGPNYIDYQRNITSLDGLAAYVQGWVPIMTADGDADRARVVRVSPEFFRTIGAQPGAGRLFSDDEFRGNPPTAIMISDAYWRRRFARDPKVLNSTIALNGFKRTVVGIMPPHFNFPEARTDMWVPMPKFNPDSMGDRSNNYLFMVGRMKPGIPLEKLRNEAGIVASHIMRDNPANFDPDRPLRPRIEVVSEQLVKGARPFLMTLLGTVGVVLLIACANVANLLLARAEGRRREMAVRSALGASSRRLVTQMFTESTLVAVVGGAVGLGVAWLTNRVLVAVAPDTIPRLDEVGIDWRVVVFAFGASVITGVLIGAVPAVRAVRGNASDALKAGSRAVGGGVVRGMRRALVAAEVGLAVVALAGAGMLLRSLWNLESVDTGFVAHGVLTARISIPRQTYNDVRAAAFFEDLITRIDRTPGVQSAGAAGWLPVVDASGLWGYAPEGRVYGPNGDGDMPSAAPQQVTRGFFKAIGTRIVAGRDFTDQDREGAMNVAIVSESFAKVTWPGQDALGKRFRVGGNPTIPMMTIVGIASDIRARGYTDRPEPTMYFPYAQTGIATFFMPRDMAIVVRTTGEPMSVAHAVTAAAHAIDPAAPVSEIRSLDDVVGTSVATRKFSTALLGVFAVLALVLAGIGTYGVISYGVAQRRYEIGVRMADGVRMCLVGVGVGIAATVLLGRTIHAMLFGVSPIDAPTLGFVCLTLLGVAAIASVVPARRAMGVSPTEALRGD
jgi:predicted permease